MFNVGEGSDTNETISLHPIRLFQLFQAIHLSIVDINDQSRFKHLLLRMIVFNAMPFTFVENEDTIAVFEFLVPEIKLPKCKVIDDKVLMKNDETPEQELIITDLDYQVSSDNEDNVEEETTTRSYRENQFENKDDKILLSKKHPADDETAKWPLDSLFVSSLEMPVYFNSELANF
ncbi:5917_t:CDS:2 [Scutellospora calospora]|uniref:5917_t:CDS:1 n=1 Tax=Scutellospora calospora TaxID=85575 RepID=A0ACA9LGJ1_9GLOM|nr:5917_t:CDS:2 [Scutellospora calospora]